MGTITVEEMVLRARLMVEEVKVLLKETAHMEAKARMEVVEEEAKM